MKGFSIMMQRVLVITEKYIIERILGGWDSLLFALVLFMVVEYLTQILVAVKNRRKSREVGFCGIAKKFSILFLIAMANVIDALIIQNGSMIRMAVIIFYLSYEGRIILKNVAILGLPIPQKLENILEQLKEGKK